MNIKKSFGLGLALAIPIMVILYVLIRIVTILEKIIAPFAKKLGIEKLLGEFTLIFAATFLLLVFIVLLGYLTRFAIISALKDKMQNLILILVPSLNYIKALAIDNLELEQNEASWKPVLFFYENKYSPGFVVEESDILITIFVLKNKSLQEGEVLIVARNEVKLIPITSSELHKGNRAFGKGFIDKISDY